MDSAFYEDPICSTVLPILFTLKFHLFIQNNSEAKTKQKQCESKQKSNKILTFFCKTLDILNLFVYNMVRKQKASEKTMQFHESDSYISSKEYGINSIACCGEEIGTKFRIVVPSDASLDETMLSHYLQYYLSVQYGYDIEISDDSTVMPHEIRIGNTTRSSGGSFGNGFKIISQNGSMEFLASNARGYEAMTDYISQTLLHAGSGSNYSYPNGWSYEVAETGLEKNGTVLADSTPKGVRIMFYNIYGFHESGPIEMKATLQAELMDVYAPDVIGLQEYSPYYRSLNFDSLLNKIGYTKVSVPFAKTQYTPMFYRADKLEVIQCGDRLYGEPNDTSKGLTWAIFRVKDTNQKIIVINTHFMWDQPEVDGPAARIANASEMLEMIETLQAMNGCSDLPLIFGGDLNCNLSSDALINVQSGGMVDAWELAAEKNDTFAYHSYATYDSTWKTYTKIPSVIGKHSTAIDHAFVTPGTKVQRFYSIISPYTLYSSDHMPTIVEIALDGTQSK